jgi:pantoate--beta-alanine ligase
MAAAAGGGERDATRLVALGHEVVAREPLARLEYLELVQPDSFEPAGSVLPGSGALAVAAAWLGDVRLIDNLPVG